MLTPGVCKRQMVLLGFCFPSTDLAQDIDDCFWFIMIKFAESGQLAQTQIFMDGFYDACLRNLNQVICQRGVTSFGY